MLVFGVAVTGALAGTLTGNNPRAMGVYISSEVAALDEGIWYGRSCSLRSMRSVLRVVTGLVCWGLVGAAGAQGIPVNVPAPLLPTSFGGWKQATTPAAAVPEYSLANANRAALEECGPQRSAVADYVTEDHGGEVRLHVEAIQFNDRTGAYSAYTLVKRPGMVEGKELGSADAVGQGAILFTAGTSIVLVTGGSANPYEVASLKPLAMVLPKISGSKGVAPLLPTELPEKGLVAGSVRYALGPATFAAEGGPLPAQSLGWEKSAEAVVAHYDDKRGKETLTLLLYPTPPIAEGFAKSIQSYTQTRGGHVRRELELVMLAEGTFSPDETQKMLENIHLKQQLSIDRDMPPVFQVEVKKTYSLLQNIAVLAGVLMLSAVLLGVFLGYGRAAIRVLRGKPAAAEVEFLALHLDPQNAAPRIEPEGPNAS